MTESSPIRRRLVAALLTALAGSVASAQQLPLIDDALEAEEEVRRYSVEVILFTYDTSVSAGTEIFMPEEPPPGAIADAVSIIEPYALGPAGDSIPEPVPDESDAEEDIPVYSDMDLLPGAGNLSEEPLEEILSADTVGLTLLTQDELSLADVHEKLLTLDAYRPIVWSGWVQEVRDEAETPPIRLRRLGNAPLEFDGSLKLYLSRFLHLVVDLSLEERVPRYAAPTRGYGEDPYGRGFGYPRDDYEQPRILYEISENRIIKSGDIRYFDHPKFGLLAKLTRIEEIDGFDESGDTEEEPPETTLPRPVRPVTSPGQ